MKHNFGKACKSLSIQAKTVLGTLILASVLFVPRINYGQENNQTKLIFDLNTDVTQSENFYNIPFPSDLRLDEQNRPNMTGYPISDQAFGIFGIKAIASDRFGFPTTSVAYFRFNGALSSQNLSKLIPAKRNSPVLLIDIDPNSPERGKLYPTVAEDLIADSVYIPEHLLAVAPYPGIVLPPNRKYAYVVMKTLKDAKGKRLGAPSSLKKLLSRGRPPKGLLGQQAARQFAPLRSVLSELRIPPGLVAAATVFTTGHPASELKSLSNQVRRRYDLSIENLSLDPEDGTSHERFCQLRATINFPQFQVGTPPFNSDGLFQIDSDGTLVEQRFETANVAITIPKTKMPKNGYPLIFYFHGSNGLSTQVVDRGPILEPGGTPAKGLGPAHVVAEHGFAAVGSSLPVNPERAPGAPEDAYQNLNNLAAYRDTFRQGVIEQRLLLDAIKHLRISPEILAGCSGPSLPRGATHFRFQTKKIGAIGQSHGAQYANMFGAVEPKVKAVAPTGSGAFWSLYVAIGDLAPLASQLLVTDQPINYLHPGLQLLQMSWEGAEPMAYMPHIAARPLPGHQARSIYKPVGLGDTENPLPIFDALVVATKLEQAGNIFWSSMQTSLGVIGLDGIIPYPVNNNLTSTNGQNYTGVVVQYEGDEIADPHGIFAQLDEVKYQYGCFFKTAIIGSKATVPAPAPLGTPCPQ